MGFGPRNLERILEYNDAMDMVVCNTLFKPEERHLVMPYTGGHRSKIVL